MARSQANLLPTIFEGLAGTTPIEKLLYVELLVEPTVNHAGLGALRVSRWAKELEVPVDDIEKALLGLDEKRFVLVDHDTEEVLVRTLIRNDGVSRQPNVLRGALRAAVLTRSPRLRRALAGELRRLPPKPEDQVLKSGKVFVHPDPHACAEQLDPTPPGTGGQAVDNPGDNPGENPSRTLPEGFETEGFPNPSRTLGGGGGGGGGGSNCSVGGPVGEARAARTTPTPPPHDENPTASRPGAVPAEPPTCPRRHAIDKPCRRCRDLREQWEADVARADAEQTRAAAESAAAVRAACIRCDDHGWMVDAAHEPLQPARKCDHRPALRAVSA